MGIQQPSLTQEQSLHLELGCAIVSHRDVDAGTQVLDGVTRELRFLLDNGGFYLPVVTLRREGYEETVETRFTEGFHHTLVESYDKLLAEAAVNFWQENHEGPEVYFCVDYQGLHCEALKFVGDVKRYFKTRPIEDPDRHPPRRQPRQAT
jgi:hypothetical protein